METLTYRFSGGYPFKTVIISEKVFKTTMNLTHKLRLEVIQGKDGDVA